MPLDFCDSFISFIHLLNNLLVEIIISINKTTNKLMHLNYCNFVLSLLM